MMTSLLTFVNALASFLVLSNTLPFLNVFCALRGNLIEIFIIINSTVYDVKMTSNYFIVSIKFIYLDVGDDDNIVLCNINNEHIMSQPTAVADHFSLTGHL